MNKIKERKKIELFKSQSITSIMFWLSFGTIVVVLLIGFIIIGVIAPRVYCTSVMNEIETSLVATIEYYDVNLNELYLNSLYEIEVEVYQPFDGNGKSSVFQSQSDIKEFLENIDQEKVVQTINIRNVLSSLTISRGAVIEITDADNNIIYQTPSWYQENLRSVRSYNATGDSIAKNPFLGSLIVDNEWVAGTTILSLDQDYVLKVMLDLRSFNQNIVIFRKIFIYMIAVGGLFALLFSVILSFIVTRPLKELKKIAQAMETMDFTVRYDEVRDDEIGQLGKTLNHMMDRLHTNIDKLQAELQKEKRTDKLRREFVAQVSHELKTPVAIVSNYTEALLDGVADSKEEQDSYLNTIENECHKMTHIINDLLDLSQMEAGTFAINKSKFEFTDLLEDLIGKHENMIKGRVKFIQEINVNSAIMYADELRIEQAVSNLISNAVKHTKENGYIKLSASKENGMLHIQVENKGEPIDSKILIHIWDSFVKGADEKGAGLGLSITKNIVELHNGEYYVRNLEDSVVFGIRLPLCG